MNYYYFLLISLIVSFGVRAAIVDELQTDLQELNGLLAQVREQFASLKITLEPSEQQKKEAEKKQREEELEKKFQQGLSKAEQAELFEDLQNELVDVATDFNKNPEKYSSSDRLKIEKKIKEYYKLANNLDEPISGIIQKLRLALPQKSESDELYQQEIVLETMKKNFAENPQYVDIYRYGKIKDKRDQIQLIINNLITYAPSDPTEKAHKELLGKIQEKKAEKVYLPNLAGKEAVASLIGQINVYETLAQKLGKTPKANILEFKNQLIKEYKNQLLNFYGNVQSEINQLKMDYIDEFTTEEDKEEEKKMTEEEKKKKKAKKIEDLDKNPLYKTMEKKWFEGIQKIINSYKTMVPKVEQEELLPLEAFINDQLKKP